MKSITHMRQYLFISAVEKITTSTWMIGAKQPRKCIASLCVVSIAFSLPSPSITRAQTPTETQAQLTTISSGIINRTKRGVVRVSAGEKSGSGFVVDFKGNTFIVTNAHVIESETSLHDKGAIDVSSPIYVQSISGEKVEAKVWRASRAHDIAILRTAQLPGHIVPLRFAGTPPQIGEMVFAWGAPYGVNLVPLDGAVTKIQQNSNPQLFDGEPVLLIFSQLSVAPGSSGGPLLDQHGQVVGVITARETNADGIYHGISIAISSTQFLPSLENLPFNEEMPLISPRKYRPRKAIRERPNESSQSSSPRYADESEFLLALSQSSAHECVRTLKFSGNAGAYKIFLSERGRIGIIHFPHHYSRVEFIENKGEYIAITLTRSETGGSTILCLVR